jgi:hemerythrin-like domain-containing protein
VVTRVIDDHREFNRLVAAIDGGGGDLRPLLESFVDLLKRHVKWEEQRFFPHCEQVLCDADLELIRGELDQGHLPDEVTWDDPFWG